MIKIQIISYVMYGFLTLILIGIGSAIIKLKKKKISAGAAIAMILIFVIVMLVASYPYFVIYRGLPAGSGRVVGEYTEFSSMLTYWSDEQWKIGSNKYGEPIFGNPKEAFELANEEFEDIIELIQDEYGFDDFSMRNYEEYNHVIFKVNATGDAAKQQFNFSEFIEIYENSQKTWHYLPAEGWVRS